MKLALGQFHPELGNKEKNLNKIHQILKDAAAQKVDIVLLPELCLTGYFIQDLTDTVAETVKGESISQVQNWCKNYNLYTVFTWPELGEEGEVYNSAALISNQGHVIGIYRKVHLYDTEKQVFAAGDTFKVFDTNIGKVGLMICFDLDFPESSRMLSLSEADIILCSTNNMKPYQEYQEVYLKSRAMENETPIALCNRTGKEREATFFGESAIYDVFGTNILKMNNEPNIKSAEVSIQQKKDPQLQYKKNRKPKSYQHLVKRELELP